MRTGILLEGASYRSDEFSNYLGTYTFASLDDYLAGAEVLRPADMDNRRTWEAGHNGRAIDDLVHQFRRERHSFVERLAAWDSERIGQSALHPRLKQLMRVIDMAFFVAEHDDHHLARMTELKRRFAAFG